MTSIVLDTNVLISALLTPRGNEALVLRLALAGGFHVCISPELLAEYEEVLKRPRFAFQLSTIDHLLTELRSSTKLVHPKITVSASPDEPDNRFLECAQTAKAMYLVTGNKRHFPKIWKETKIVSARELLEATMPL